MQTAEATATGSYVGPDVVTEEDAKIGTGMVTSQEQGKESTRNLSQNGYGSRSSCILSL